MDRHCHRCGAPVEDGVLFCKQCGAPQIRVAIEPTLAPGPVIEALPERHQDRISLHEPAPPLHWAQASAATVLGGLLEALFTLFGLGIVAGGFLSVALFRRKNPGIVLTRSLGARLGLISGAIGFGIFAVLRSVGLLVLGTGGAMRELVMKQLEQTAAQYPGPEAQQTLQYLRSPEGWALIVAMSTIFTLIAFLVLSMLGGMAGGAVLGKKDRRDF